MTDTDLQNLVAENTRQIAEVWALFRETREQIREQQKKTDEQLARTDAKIEKLIDTWSRFIECFLAPGLPRAFQERGIPILGTAERQKRKVAGKQMEIDILGVDTDCVVAVEVKTTLRPEHVSAFLERLPNFKQFFPEYKDRLVHGAVAGIEVVQAAEVFAEKQGLWVIAQRGDTVIIQNDGQFKPKTW